MCSCADIFERIGPKAQHQKQFRACNPVGQTIVFCGLLGWAFGPDSVGINRREVVNEKVIQERSSESILTPSM
jgi:hypothetical protein